jgi:methionyl-tRNA formyltransferase
MNVLIITEEDVFYVYEFFKVFFPYAQKADYNVKCIMGFYGLIYFFRMSVLYLIKRIAGHTVKRLSKEYNIDNLPTKNVNESKYIKKIIENKIDIILSIAAPQIFKKEILNSVKYGCINSHSSLLPENKGMMPVFWGLYKGEPEIGVTIHYMDEKLDSGNIIKQEKVPVNNRSLHRMILKTKRMSALLVHKTLNDIMNGKLESVPMPKGGSYQTFPTPDEVKEFKRRGNKIL